MTSQLTKLLTNAQLARLERWRLDFSDRFTNRAKGGHLAHKGGASTDFADYRDYAPGDDLRFIDWNIFSRLQRPYVKQFHHEEIAHVLLLLDGSNSMMREGKFQLAKQAAAAIAMLALRGTERLSVVVMQEPGPDRRCRIGPVTGRHKLREILGFLEATPGGGFSSLEDGIELALRDHKGRGAAVLLSDFLSFGDMTRPMNRLYGAGMEVYGLQILAPDELDPSPEGDLRLVDSENGAVLDISASPDLLALYHEHLQETIRLVQWMCRQRGGSGVCVSSDLAPDELLFDLWPRHGWMVRT